MSQSKLIAAIHQLAVKDKLVLPDLNDKNTVIICGAGISIESKLPSGWDLIKKVLDTFDLGHGCRIDLVKQFENYNNEVISKIQSHTIKLYDAPRLEVLFKCIKDVLPEDEYHLIVQAFLYYNYREKVYNTHIYSNYQHFAIAEFIQNGGLVLTANFDNLIEHALSELDADLVYNKISFPCHSLQTVDMAKGSLIKYHGDIRSINSIGIDISNLTINGFGKEETTLLDSLFEHISNVIFIGFSVSDTLDLIPYLNNRKNKLTYYFFHFTALDSSVIKSFEAPDIGRRIEAYEYFFSKGVDAYVVNNYLNEIQKKANPYTAEHAATPAFQLTSPQIAAMEKLMAKLADTANELHTVIKMNILKTYGLLNWVNEAELNKLSGYWGRAMFAYWQNIRGNYRYNYYQIIRQQQGTGDIFKKFGALQEYVFLQQRFVFDRICKFVPLTFRFFQFYYRLKRKQKDVAVEFKLNRSVCLYMLRIFQVLYKNKMTGLMPQSIVNKHESLVQRQIQIAQQLNNLSIYKFALKEQLYVKGLFKHRFTIAKGELEQTLVNLYELNIDTNYFIEANNLLRFGANVIAPDMFTNPFILSASITNDELNLKKLAKQAR